MLFPVITYYDALLFKLYKLISVTNLLKMSLEERKLGPNWEGYHVRGKISYVWGMLSSWEKNNGMHTVGEVIGVKDGIVT